MVDYVASCVLSASAWARIDALVANASLVATALGAEDALRPAGFVWVAYVLRQACAYAVVALSVRAAW